MIALTPQSLKSARFELARHEFSQKSGKTNAPTIRLDGKAPSSRELKRSSRLRCVIRNGYHNASSLLEAVTESPLTANFAAVFPGLDAGWAVRNSRPQNE